jgi:uncharacterized repeat protein (TIGR01451 family)
MPSTFVTVSAGLPFGKASFESESHPSDVTLISQGGNQMTWRIDELLPNDVRTFYVVGRAANNLTLGTDLQFNALVSAAQDFSYGNNQTQVITTIEAPVQATATQQAGKLSVTYTAAPTSAQVGETVSFEVSATNTTTNEVLYNLDLFADLAGGLPLMKVNYPDPAFPGRLLPGQTATGTFSLLIQADFLSKPYAWAKADDSDPADGDSLVVARGNLASFQVLGPGLTLTIEPDLTSVTAGDPVTFTVTVENDSHRHDTAEAIVIQSLLSNETLTLNPPGPLAPGESTSASFTYTTTTDDIPEISARLDLTAKGVTYPDVEISLSQRAQVLVLPSGTANPDAPNLVIDLPNTAGAIPGLALDLPFVLRNSGEQLAPNTSFRLTLPSGVNYVGTSPNEIAATYDPVLEAI